MCVLGGAGLRVLAAYVCVCFIWTELYCMEEMEGGKIRGVKISEG